MNGTFKHMTWRAGGVGRGWGLATGVALHSLAAGGCAAWGQETPREAQAGADAESVVELPAMVVTAEAEYEERTQPAFLPPVQGTEIYAGKKATVIDLDALPKVQANNYRQALALTPGLLYSEETTPLVSLGYRGIGEPHRMQYFQVLEDGIPIHADMFGYPEAYYTPPLDVVDRVEFIRGGASLMYGPHHAGAVNYVTYRPRGDRPFSVRSQQIFGTDDLYSTYNSVDGTVGRVGYLAYYNHRQSDGFRTANSDYVLDGGHFKVVLDADRDSRWLLAMDAYEEEHGEPGGLNFGTGPNDANYAVDRDRATKLYDRFHLRRYVPALTYERDWSEQTRMSVKSWGGYYDRLSRRQGGGGFGTFPTGAGAASNAIERQEFYTFGLEGRLAHDYSAGAHEHTLAGGLLFYRGESPRTDRRGATPDAEDGPLTAASDRETLYGAAFVENRFQLGRLSVTPGFRLENVHQSVDGRVYDPATGRETAPSAKENLDIEPLVALGVAYQASPTTELYGNVAQSYRTTIFSESIVPTSGAVISGDLEPTTGWTYEVGYRGTVGQWLQYDTSLFLVDLDNRYGGTTTAGGVTVIRNVGRSINYGWEAAAEVDVVGLWHAAHRETSTSPHTVSLYANVSLLEAEFHGGVADGKRPQYAPDYLLRTGAIYRWNDRVKVALLGTFVDDHFGANDSEDPRYHIPAYMTWDLTFEAKVYRDRLSVMAGINNLFNEDYYARVRSDGIDPAYGRNFYAGLSLSF